MDIVAKAFYAPIEEIKKEIIVNNLDEDELRWTYLKRKLPGFVELHNFNRWYFGKLEDMPQQFTQDMDKNAAIISELTDEDHQEITFEEMIEFFQYHPNLEDIIEDVLKRDDYGAKYEICLFEALYLKLDSDGRKSIFLKNFDRWNFISMEWGFLKKSVENDDEDFFNFMLRHGGSLIIDERDFQYIRGISEGSIKLKSTKYLEKMLDGKSNLFHLFFDIFCDMYHPEAHAMYIRAIVKLGSPSLLELFNYVNSNPDFNMKKTVYQALYLAGLDYSVMRSLKNPPPGLQEFLADNESDI